MGMNISEVGATHHHQEPQQPAPLPQNIQDDIAAIDEAVNQLNFYLDQMKRLHNSHMEDPQQMADLQSEAKAVWDKIEALSEDIQNTKGVSNFKMSEIPNLTNISISYTYGGKEYSISQEIHHWDF